MKKTFTTLLAAILLCIAVTSTGQTWNYAYSTGYNSAATYVGPGDIYSENGFTYVAGYYSGDAAAFNGTVLPLSDGMDAYLMRVSIGGTPLWAVRASGTGNSADYFYKVVADGSGVYVLGACALGPITFYSTNATSITLSNGGSFIVKYSITGIVQWATPLTTAISTQGIDIALSSASSRVYMCGQYNGSNSIMKSYSMSTGVEQWSRTSSNSGASAASVARGIGADASGNLYTVHEFYKTIGFGLPTTYTASANYDLIVTKHDINGTFSWAKVLGKTTAAAREYAKDLEVDASGNIFLTGTYQGDATIFDSYTLNNSGGKDLYMVKLDNSGLTQWAQKIGGVADDEPIGLAMDNFGNPHIAVINTPANSVTVSPCSSFSSTTSGTDYKWYIAKYNSSNGSIGWATAPTTNTVATAPVGIGAGAVGNNSSVWIAGNAEGTTTFGSTVVTASHLTYVAKVTNQNPLPTIAGATICAGQSTTLNATGPTGSGITLSWYTTATGGTAFNTGSSYTTPVLTTSTTYYVGSTLCTARTPVTVTVNKLPIVNAGPDMTICEGTCTTLGLSGSNSNGSYEWTYLNNGVPTMVALTEVAPVCPQGNGQIVYTLKTTLNNTGCSSQDQMVLTILNNHPDYHLVGQNTSNMNYYTMELDPDNQSNYSIGFTWKIEALDAADNYTVVSSSPSCWNTFNATQHTEKFPGFDATVGYTSGTTTSLSSCASPTSGKFLYGHNYRITRSTTNASCSTPVSYSNTYNVIYVGKPSGATSAIATAASNTSLNNFVVFPNPGKGIFTVTTDTKETCTLEVLDMLGRSVLKTEMKEGKQTIDLTGYAKGVYMVTISNSSASRTQKLILE